jgi:hypothetical protein
MVALPERCPPLVGVKITLIAQFPFNDRLAPQVLV